MLFQARIRLESLAACPPACQHWEGACCWIRAFSKNFNAFINENGPILKAVCNISINCPNTQFRLRVSSGAEIAEVVESLLTCGCLA